MTLCERTYKNCLDGILLCVCVCVYFLKEVTFSEIISSFILIDHFYNLFVLRKQPHHSRGSKNGACERNFKCFPDGFFIWPIVILKLTFSYRRIITAL